MESYREHGDPLPSTLKPIVEQIEPDVAAGYLERAMDEVRGNKTFAAELLGFKNYQTLFNWLKRYGIE